MYSIKFYVSVYCLYRLVQKNCTLLISQQIELNGVLIVLMFVSVIFECKMHSTTEGYDSQTVIKYFID